MNMDYWRNIIHPQKIAKWISWLSCAWILVWALYMALHFGFTKGVFIVFGVAVIHIWLMLMKKYVFAFRLAGVEIFIAILVLFFTLYPPIPGGYAEPLVRFDLAIWIWIFGGVILTITAWICFKAAKEIKSGSHTEDPNQHNTPSPI